MIYDGTTIALMMGLAFGILGLLPTDGSDFYGGVRHGLRACGFTALAFAGTMWAVAHVAIR